MDKAKPVITYEVHIKRNGKWELHVRYPENRKVQAMGKAKSMARNNNIEEVRVIEESYDPSAGTSAERVVYDDDGKPTDSKSGASHDGNVPPSPTSAAQDGGRSAIRKTKKKSSAKSKISKASGTNSRRSTKHNDQPRKMTAVAFFTRLLLVLLFSILIGMMFVWLASAVMHRTSLESATQTKILFAVFIVSFLVSIVSMSISLLSKADFKSKSARKVASRQMPGAAVADKVVSAGSDKSNETLAQEQAAAAEKAAKALAESMWSEEGDAIEKSLEEKIGQSEMDSPLYKKQKAFTAKFIDGVINHTADKIDFKEMDNFNKFGVNLFFAGACEAQGQMHELDGRTTIKLISESVQTVGFKGNESDRFAGKYHEYLLADSRYMQMFQAGRSSMNTYTSGDKNVGEDMKKAIGEWNKPKAKEQNTAPVTVMFTDMVGSTALTQDRGDAVAQKVVHAHNSIVRGVLMQYVGREIKHTGDGIMASFSNTSKCVEAAIAIQAKVATHNESNADLPLHLKIGINVGEPISEDNDLFGTTVQLSARIVDKAKSEQIFVSEAVRGICAGKGIEFVSRGSYEMKGFADPITLYEAIWRKDSDTLGQENADDELPQGKIKGAALDQAAQVEQGGVKQDGA